MQANTTLSPLINATALASRWGCHISTISRKVRTGIIKPTLRSGAQMSFAIADVLRVEAGLLPRLRSADSLTVGQRAALPTILALLELEHEELSAHGAAALCRIFHSVPHERRTDEPGLAGHLELTLLSVRAIARAESMRTIGGSPALLALVDDLLGEIKSLVVQSHRWGVSPHPAN